MACCDSLDKAEVEWRQIDTGIKELDAMNVQGTVMY